MPQMPVPPVPDAQTLSIAVLAFLAGASAPTYYAQERLRGFGRFVLSKMLPYAPPPGMEKQQALEEATDDDTNNTDDDGGDVEDGGGGGDGAAAG